MPQNPDATGPDATAFKLELTPPQLKITWNALHAFLQDFGAGERDVERIIREVLDKLPAEDDIGAIDLGL